MCTLNANAPAFIPREQQVVEPTTFFNKVFQPIFNDGQVSYVRLMDSDEYRREFLLSDFNREEVADEDLFNPAVFPVSAADHEELAAAESFNQEMAELAELEHQHELRLLLEARIWAIQQGAGNQHSQRPAKITSLHGRGTVFFGPTRGASAACLKRSNPVKKCGHNINQPQHSGRNN